MTLLAHFKEVEEAARDLRRQTAGVGVELSLIIASQYLLSKKKKKQTAVPQKLTDEEVEKIAGWVAENDFTPLKPSTIYAYSVGVECTHGKATATGLLLTSLGVPKHSGKGFSRYFKAQT